MSGILEIRKEISRALQIPLYTACTAPNPVVPIEWIGIPFERTDQPKYLKVELLFGDVSVLEMGAKPMFEASGGLSISIFTPEKSGGDANDALAKVVAQAYPYGLTSTFGGITVNIDKSTPGPYTKDGVWLIGLARVDWNCYRRGP